VRKHRRLVLLAVLAAIFAGTLPGSANAVPKSTLTLSVTANAAAPVTSSVTTVAIGQSVHLAASGLDPTRQVELYKGQWIDGPQFTGWTWVYYKGFPVAANGTWSTDEAQNTAGTFRFQVSQTVGDRHPSVVTSAYVGLLVIA
jgi:hypothetical protein